MYKEEVKDVVSINEKEFIKERIIKNKHIFSKIEFKQVKKYLDNNMNDMLYLIYALGVCDKKMLE